MIQKLVFSRKRNHRLFDGLNHDPKALMLRRMVLRSVEFRPWRCPSCAYVTHHLLSIPQAVAQNSFQTLTNEWFALQVIQSTFQYNYRDSGYDEQRARAHTHTHYGIVRAWQVQFSKSL